MIGKKYFQKTSKNRVMWPQILLALMFMFSLLGTQPAKETLAQGDETTFAIITDFGYAGNTTVANIANMVNGWNPEFIVTAGDNSQGMTCDTSCYQGVVGAYYGPEAVSAERTDFITPGNFWPVPGNHDYFAPIANYLAYFNYLPPAGSSEGATNLYYDFVRGPVHFFMLDSGQNDNSPMPNQTLQQTFLQNGLANSTAPWKIVMFHRPAYTSGTYHGSDPNLQWPFEEWGADFVIAGHNHIYERIYRDEGDLRYITAGTAGSDTRTGSTSFTGLEAYYFGNESGAMKVVASDTSITLQYITLAPDGTTETIRDTHSQTTESPTDPIITTSVSSLTTFSTLIGLPSEAKTFNVSGTNLTTDISVVSPPGFELSTNGLDYFPALTLPQTGGSVSLTTIYVRLTGAEGTFSGNITLNSSGAIEKLISVSGTADLTITVDFQEGLDGYSGMYDTFIHQADPTFNFGVSSPLLVDSDDPYGSDNDVSSFLYWDLSSIPVGSLVESASISLYIEDVTETPGYDVYAMNQSWQEGTGNGLATADGATWNTYDGSNVWPGGAGGADDKGSTVLANFTPTSTGSFTVDLGTSGISVIQNWITDSASNFGFMIHAGSTINGMDFTSSEGTIVADRPKLTLTYSLPVDDPIIVTSVSNLPPFKALPASISEVASYNVQAVNLEEDLVITAPTDFQISTSNISGFGQSLTLIPSSGSISSTTIFVRFSRSSEGTSAGLITHVSSPAVQKDVSVTGTAALTPPWTAYNDMVGTSTPAYTTEFPLGTSDGMLKDFDTGEDTNVTVDITSNGNPFEYTDGGSMPDSGTDAYEIFNGKVDFQGVIMSATSSPTDYWVDLTFENLDPSKTYTFVGTANRAGGTGGDPAYTSRITRYTISGMDDATNASSTGVQVYDTDGYSIYFCTGENTQNGYVAKWTNIQPGSDGIFKVRAQPQNPEEPRTYAYSAFMLQEEISGEEPIQISITPNPGQTKVYGENDPVLTYSSSHPEISLIGALGRDAGQNVGSYAIIQGTLSAPAGYTILVVEENFTITKRPITISANELSKQEGESDPALTYTLTGTLAYSDNITGELERETGEDPGDYNILIGSLIINDGNSGNNYNLTFNPAVFTIIADEGFQYFLPLIFN